MENYFIYNKSSERMLECESNSVDLIITSPPYNIGTDYGGNDDRRTFEEYEKMLVDILAECFRVLNSDGIMVVEIADSILIDGSYVQLANMIQNFSLKTGFTITERHINFIKSNKGILLPDHDWNGHFITKKNSHSNCHHWLIFSKKKTDFEKNGKIFYFDYKNSEDHPCPFTDEICQTMLDMYFRKGFVVLDPFMGTANLGKHVINRGGVYKGYEIDAKVYMSAENKLKYID